MATQQHQEVWSSAETAVSRVALSLDSLFVNGLLYGVIHGDAFNDFLQKPAEVLLRDVANLETKGAEASVTSGVGELLSHLRAKCRQVIEHLTSLRAFRTFSREGLRSALGQIQVLRDECLRLIHDVEDCFHAEVSPFESRVRTAPAEVDAFLADLDNLFEQKWLDAQASEGTK